MSQLDRWTLTRCVGSGGEGTVYRACEAGSSAQVAIKRYHRGREESARRELEVLRDLRHPNLPAYVDHGEADGLPFLVMEWVEGTQLDTTGSWPWPDLLQVLRQVLRAVGALHELGRVHRDLKPDNVMLADRVVVLDLGLAAPAARAENRLSGSIDWCAPEQRELAGYEPRSDLYTLGLIALACLADTPPPPGLEGMRPRRAWIDEHLLKLHLPHEIRGLLRNLVADSPQERPSDVAAVLEILDADTHLQLPEVVNGPQDLADFVRGPELALHLPSRVSHQLWMRTGGHAARLRREVAAWLDLGIARPCLGGGLQVSLSSLVDLETGMVTPTPLPMTKETLRPDAERALRLLAHTRTSILAEALAKAIGLPPEDLESTRELLVRAGCIAVTAGLWSALVRPREPADLADVDALAHDPRVPLLDRLTWMLRLESAEALTLAADLALEADHAGELGRSLRLLEHALSLAVRIDRRPDGRALLPALLTLVVAAPTPRNALVAHNWARRLHHYDLAAIASALADARTEPLGALARLRALPAGGRVAEHARWTAVLHAAAAAGTASFESVVDELRAREARGVPSLHAGGLDNALGHRAYQVGDYRRAAGLQAKAAEASSSRGARLAAGLNRAAALLEVPESVSDARAELEQILTQAESADHRMYAISATALLRVAVYRQGLEDAASADHVEVARFRGPHGRSVQICLTEAAFALRAGCPDLARRIVIVGMQLSPRPGAPGALLMAAIAVALGSLHSERFTEIAAEAIERCPPRVAVQIAALSGVSFPNQRARFEEIAPSPARREVLSMTEALTALGLHPPESP